MKKLDYIEKKNNFKVPENYFENFDVNLDNYINDRIQKYKKVTLFQKIKPYIYFAACFLGFFFIGRTIVEFAIEKSQKSAKVVINENIQIEEKQEKIDDEQIDTYEYLSFQQNIEYELGN